MWLWMLAFLVLSQISSDAASLEALRDASCTYHEKLVNDMYGGDCALVDGVLVRQEGGGLDCYYTDGNGQRLPEKLRKNCESRIPDAIAYCQTGMIAQAHQQIVNARNAMEDHEGLLTLYIIQGGMPYWLFLEDAGPILSGQSPPFDPRDYATQTAAKLAMWGFAAAEPPQTTLTPDAHSLLAELYNKEALASPCGE